MLEQLKWSGWPCFPLGTQFRGVSGQFDLAREVMYPDLPEFRYADETALPRHDQFLRTEAWVRARYGAPPSPTRKILPLFFDCVDSVCLPSEEGRSRHNSQ